MRWIDVGLIGMGIGLRLAQAFYGRPLWRDEIALLANLQTRSFLELVLPLDDAQAAPVPFLWLEKAALLLFGPEPLALRLVPLLASIAALLLMARLARQIAPDAAPLALGFFAASTWLIYYANETKQYALDVIVALWLLWLAWDRTRLVRFRLAGMLAVWCSHPAIFVLGALAASDWLAGARRRALVSGSLWLASFGLAYALLYRHTAQNPVLLDYWATREPAFIQPTLLDIAQAVVNAGMLVSGLFQPLLLVLVLVGFVLGARYLPLPTLVVLLGPIAAAAAASMLGRYPYSGRFLLFALPGLTLLAAVGLTDALKQVSAGRAPLRAMLTALLIIGAFAVADSTQDGLFR